jgi:MEDS: MEthanogen/methylotroph, DcmR Sensory domain
MTPYQRRLRRTVRRNNRKNYVVLDRTWAERLGVQRTGGKCRIGRRDLAERLARLNEPKVGYPHCVGFYETEAFLASCVHDFLSPALVAGDTAIVVASASHGDACGRALERAGIDLREVARQGRYFALDAAATLSTFMVDAMPNAARFRSTMGELISLAAQDQRVVCIYGEMVAVLWDQGNIAAAIALERLWNDLAYTHPFSLLCAYPIRAFNTDAGKAHFQEVCAQHSEVIATVG